MIAPTTLKRAMIKTKTVLVIDYKTIGNPLHNRVLKNLDIEVCVFVAENMPCVVCAFFLTNLKSWRLV